MATAQQAQDTDPFVAAEDLKAALSPAGVVIPSLTVDTTSPECAVAVRRGYEDLHARCRQTEDVPLPSAIGLLLVHRCTCRCHGYNRQKTSRVARSSQVTQ